jgi:hypothetical protein
MRVVQMKHVRELFWAKELRIVPKGVETGIPLTHQPVDALRKELPGLLLETLHHSGLDVFFRPESTDLSVFLRGMCAQRMTFKRTLPGTSLLYHSYGFNYYSMWNTSDEQNCL